MEINMNTANKYTQEIQQRMQIAINENRPDDARVYARKLIELLQDSHDEFINTAKKQGHDLNSTEIGEVEVEQYSAMMSLAKKVGLPVEEYKKSIEKVRRRVFGDEFYKDNFKE